MNITQPKNLNKLSNFVKDLINNLKFKNNKLLLLGSGSLEANFYPSDYDFFTNINKYNNLTKIYEEIENILDRTINNNVYFVELKIQFLNGDKKKYFKLPIDFFNNSFHRKDIDFIKIDFIIYDKHEFTDVSIIYNLNKNIISKESLIKSLDEDIKELNKEKKYFKVCKRMYSKLNLNKEYKKMVYLMTLFNSDFGRLYQITSKLETIKNINSLYRNNYIINQKIKFNLSKYNIESNINLKGINEIIKSNSKIFNNEAKKYIDYINNEP